MKQVFRENRTGRVWVEEVPPPSLKKGGVLVQNLFSAISVGTEGASLKLAKSGILEKAKKRPEDVRKIKQLIKDEGIIEAYKKVKEKLEIPTPVGYSCVGKVLEVGEGVEGFSAGDVVACGGGGYAVHAEVVWVPKNLCVKVPQGVRIEHAAFTTIGAIAIQGLRQAGIQFGENVLIIGLGVVGQLAAQVAKASGARVVAVDIDRRKVDLAEECGIDLALLRSESSLEEKIMSFTDGYGIDAVVITAATSSVDPLELALRTTRHKGRITVVGSVPMTLERKPFYKKELSLNIARSYGPGRYDPIYEEKGIDYPIGYVRWTENRNMRAFLDLLADDKLRIDRIITHRFKLEEAPHAYEKIIKNDEELVIGALFEYPTEVDTKKRINLGTTRKKADSKPSLSHLNVGFIGAGHYAQNFLLPVLAKNPWIQFRGVATTTAVNSSYVGKKYGFDYITTDPDEVIKDKEIDAAFIATRHNTHAMFAVRALESGKHVFVEKPLAINEKQLESVIKAWQASSLHLMVGFNRRFSPLVSSIKDFFGRRRNPLAINYRINAGFLDKNHWVQDPEVGGGRIIGEVCHFVDLCNFLISSKPKKIFAQSITSGREDVTDCDTVVITIGYKDGSVASIQYFSNGDKSYPKEYLEVFGENSIAVLDDFREVRLVRKGKTKRIKLHKKDKGQANELAAFIKAVKEGMSAPIPFDEIVIATITTFKILESLRTEKPVEMDEIL